MPTQWARYRDIDDVDPLNEDDVECLAEVSAVLKKHGKRERFGVALLHKHFRMEEDEQLVEVTDADSRTLTIRPVKKDAVGNTVETVWELGDGPDATTVTTLCQIVCWKDDQTGNHGHEHKTTITGE